MTAARCRLRTPVPVCSITRTTLPWYGTLGAPPRSSSGRVMGTLLGAQVGGRWRASAYTYP